MSEKSLDTTRRLDDTYYSILERATALSSTIRGLQELSSLTRELHANFENDTTELKTEVHGQIEAFGRFKRTKERVDGVASRMQAVKDKCLSLSDRLESAKHRVEGRERSEAERHKQTERMYSCQLGHRIGST